jgi:hypothetical protein
MSNPERDFKARPVNGKEVEITEYLGDKWEVIIPSHIQGLPVTCIGAGAFKGKNLIGVTIPDSVTEIGTYAFADNKLTSVIIPNSVTKIGHSVFENNNLLTSITIGANIDLFSPFGNTSLLNSNSFVDAYEAAGKAAGTYTRPDRSSRTWTKV